MLRPVLISTIFVLVVTGVAHGAAGTILIFPFENRSSDRSLDWIGEGIAELMIERLQSEPGLYVFTRDERLRDYEKLGIPERTPISRATQLKLGWEIGADKIVTGSFTGTAEDFQITARYVDIGFSGPSEEANVRGRLLDVINMSSELARKIAPENSTTLSLTHGAFENYTRGILNPDAQKQISFLETAVRQDPGYTAGLFELGQTYHRERDFGNSNRWLERITGPGPELLRAQFIMGLNYYYLGDYDRSMATFQQMPSTYDVSLNLGAAAAHKGDSAAAIEAWTRAASLDPLRNEAFFDLGYASLLGNDLEAAAKYLNESLNLLGHDSEALFLLGRVYEGLGKMEESQRLIAEAARLSQRVERWLTQPPPRLERLAPSAAFSNANEIWIESRIVRRTKALGLTNCLELARARIDAHQYGEAIREIQIAILVFPDATEARDLLNEINRQRTTR